MQLTTILNRVEYFKSFVYGKTSWVDDADRPTLEVKIEPRKNGQPICSVCEHPAPGYDRLPERRFEFVPMWGIAVFFVYAMRRVECPTCGVKVEQVPWCDGKNQLTTTYRWFLAGWAQRLSWQGVASAFGTSWQNVYRSVKHAVSWGLARYRKKLIQQRGDQCNRIQKLLEACNIKLASVATDVLGVSGREMLQAIVEGESDPARLAEMARGRMRKKIPELIQALEGHVSDTQRWLLGEQLDHIAELDRKIVHLDKKVEELTGPFDSVIERLCEIPGVSRRVSEVIIAEIGVDMKRFPTAKHLASWAGMCPGHHESAGKRKSGRTRHGSNWLKTALMEAGWAASRTKETYLSAQYRNISRRRGKKRACVAVGHSGV